MSEVNKKMLEPTVQTVVNNIFKTAPTTYVVINPYSYYYNACLAEGFCQPEQYLVIGFQAWLDWFNEQTNDWGCSYVPPAPFYCADKYIHAVQVSNMLNEGSDSYSQQQEAK